MKTAIITDTTADLTLENVRALGVEVVPLSVCFGDKSYRDSIDITKEDFYKLQAESSVNPTTSQPNPEDFLSVFKKHLDLGEEVLYVAISSRLSGTIQSAKIAKDMCGADADRVYIVDTLNVTAGLEALVRYACRLRDEGKSRAEIAKLVESKKDKVRVIAVVDTLKYLVRGGRVSKTVGILGGALGIKPLLAVKDGEVASIGTARGQKAAFEKLLEIVKSEEIDGDMPLILTHANDYDSMKLFEDFIKSEGVDFPWTYSRVGSVIGTHTGPGCVAMGDLTDTQITISGPGYDGVTVYEATELAQIAAPGQYTVTEVHAPTFNDPHLGYVNSKGSFSFTITGESSSAWYANYQGNGIGNKRQKGVIEVQKVDNEQSYLNHANNYYEYIDCVICHNNFLTCEHTTQEYNTHLEQNYTQSAIERGVPDPTGTGGKFPLNGTAKSAYIEAFERNKPMNIEDDFYRGHDMRVQNPLPQGDATFKGAQFKIYAEEDIKLANGDTIITKGTEVDTLETDDNGYAKSKELDLGVYKVVETSPPTGYQFQNWQAEQEAVIVDIVYSGDETQAVHNHYVEFADSVIKGHFAIQKLLDYDDDNEKNDNHNGQVDELLNGQDVYYAVYLNSKADKAGDSQFSRTRLPDEFFLPKPFDSRRPLYKLVEGQGEVVDNFHYGSYEWVDDYGNPTGEKVNPTLNYPVDNTRENIAIKELYMVLKTNARGKAATYDSTSIAYINLPYIGGDGNNDRGITDTDLWVDNSSYPLPYGTYTVVEITPNEGYPQGGVVDNQEHPQTIF